MRAYGDVSRDLYLEARHGIKEIERVQADSFWREGNAKRTQFRRVQSLGEQERRVYACVRKLGPDRSCELTNVLKQRGIAVMTEEEERVPHQRGALH